MVFVYINNNTRTILPFPDRVPRLMFQVASFVTTELVYLYNIMKNQHGHWVCWMSASRNIDVKNEHTCVTHLWRTGRQCDNR